MDNEFSYLENLFTALVNLFACIENQFADLLSEFTVRENFLIGFFSLLRTSKRLAISATNDLATDIFLGAKMYE
ncbi:MAG: hypothetical protein WBP45_08070 [Daejeonella sp.]